MRKGKNNKLYKEVNTRATEMEGEGRKNVVLHGPCPKKMLQIDEKGKERLKKVQRKQSWGCWRAGE